ncbi:nucleoside monophosphate kinase [Tardiphaga sp. 538_B7_N1_4]|jgi:adenylosuccinate synthase|uniref:nucleoside monophosphate kinase n=1 Tax=Tardiphaga sp. 538_B7_N1_4 TaxID=3240778 RepID=UPI003F1EBD88
MKRLLLLSGPIAAGKSTVATALVEHHQFERIRSGDYLREISRTKGLGSSRADLQSLGDSLDAATNYRWIIDDVAAKTIETRPEQDSWLFDSVRKNQQVTHFKKTFPNETLHIHFTASDSILRERYESRITLGDEYFGNTPYDIARLHPNEVHAQKLIEVADIIFDLSQTSPEKTAAEILKNWNTGERNASSRLD